MNKQHVKKVVAWEVSNHEEDTGVVVFHHHGLAARREGANELESEFDSVECCRAPQFDSFAEKGKVPLSGLFANGWWQSCMKCGRKMGEDYEGGLKDIVIEDDDGHIAFCNKKCQSEHHQVVKQRQQTFEAFKEKVKKLRPDLTFTEFKGGYPWITNVAKFTFPGCKYGGSVRDRNGNGNIEWFVAHGDQDAWERYEKQRAS